MSRMLIYGIACGNVVPSAPSKTQRGLAKNSPMLKKNSIAISKLKRLGEDRAANLTVSSAGGKRVSRSQHPCQSSAPFRLTS